MGGENLTADESIFWEGLWYYSQKQARGANDRCGFKYSFVGSAQEVPAGASSAKDGSNDAQKAPDTSRNRGQGRRDGGTGTQNVHSSSSGNSVGNKAAASATSKNGVSSSKSPSFNAINSSGSESYGVGARPPPPTIKAYSGSNTGQGSSALPPAGGGDGVDDARGVQGEAGGADGGVGSPCKKPVPLSQQLSLYGPGGDGRLPSGKWAGYFIVKYSRGVEVKVEESFMLEFGVKSPRKKAVTLPASAPVPTTPAPPPLARPAVATDSNRQTTTATAVDRKTVDESAVGEAAAVVGISAAVKSSVGPMVVGPFEGNTVGPTAASPAPTPVFSGAVFPPVIVAGQQALGLASETARGTEVAATTATSPATTVAPSVAATTAEFSVVSTRTASVAPAISSIPAPIAPVVRVSGWGHNKYGEFTLTGGHERATGRLDLTRFYYEKPKKESSSASSLRNRSGTGVSHQKKRRPPPPGAPAPQPPGPSLAERRTKRTRCPNQRLLDDESFSNNGQSEISGGGGGGSAGGSSGPMKRRASGESSTTSANPLGEGSGSIAPAVGGASGGSSGSGGISGKARKPRDRERDLFMEQNRRARRKAEEAGKSTSISGDSNSAGARGSACSSPSESAAAELAARAEAGREVLAAIGATSEDPVVKVRRAVFTCVCVCYTFRAIALNISVFSLANCLLRPKILILGHFTISISEFSQLRSQWT